MPISQAVLEQYQQSNVILVDGYEFLCDAIQRFLDSGLPEHETFLLARLDEENYRVERFDNINVYLRRHKDEERYSELYRPISDLTWLPKVARVVDMQGVLGDQDVAAWRGRHEGEALVIAADGEFHGLIYKPFPKRGGSAQPLRELFSRWIGPIGRVQYQSLETVQYADDGPKGLLPIDEDEDEAMALPPDPTNAAPPLTIPFHTDIRFANWLKPGETRPLTVQLTKEMHSESRAHTVANVSFVDEFTPETVFVHLDAPGFSERTDTWRRSIEVFSFQDSDKATFILTANQDGGQDEGERQISVDFRHKNRLIGNARFVVQVSSQPVTAGPVAADALTFRQPPPDITISTSPPPPPDVELRIRVDGKRLTFELNSPHQRVDASNAPMGGVELTTEPQTYMQERYDELNLWARQRSANADVMAEIGDRLTAIGNNLFLSLFPDKLKRVYWKLVKLRQEGLISNLHIVSDEPWIPWEMVKPVDVDADEVDDFLAQGWQVSRWLAGPGQVDKLEITAARLVAPDTDLTQVRRERDFFAALPARHVTTDEPLRKLAQVRQIAKEGVELLHFSTHGRVNNESIDRSVILLDENTELRPDDLLGEAVLGLRKRRPLIFLNTCHGARMGFSLAGLGGWASQMINQVRAGIFVGALWEVNDELAADFALAFYGELQAGRRLGEAFHTARMGIRTSAPTNSTWLAYTLYGDPNIQVMWGKTTADSGRPTADER